MKMADKFSGQCPCGFSFITPHGEADAIDVISHHVERIHKKDFPNGLPRSEALKDIKKM